jgi:PhzF family phenazine biosynthesis protein
MNGTYTAYQADAFTAERFLGNPAGVIPNADGLSQGDMQAIAGKLGNPAAAFVLPPTASDHDIWIRFFTPTTEEPICGHAAIAAHYVRALENQLPTSVVHQKTGAGILPVEIVRDDAGYMIITTQGIVEIAKPFEQEINDTILAALGLARSDLDNRCPIQIMSTGHSKVMVGIRSRATLNALTPDFAALSEISGLIDCTGHFVFTFDSNSAGALTHGPMFAPAAGVPEDPVTGNANGALGATIVHHGSVAHDGRLLRFTSQQGEAMARKGSVEVYVEIDNGRPVRTKVGGQALVVFQTEIEV